MWKRFVNMTLQVGLRSAFQPQQKIGVSLLEAETTLAQQFRTTFILKRKWPPGLTKKNQKPKKLSARHFVYELEEDTNTKKQEDLKLILTNYVEGLGHRGDSVCVKPNFGYQKLLLPGLAVYATPENAKKYTNLKSSVGKYKETHSSPTAERTMNVLSRLVLAVVMNKEIPWQLEPWHVKASFRKAGIHLDNATIELPAEPITGPNLAFESKSFYVTVTINNMEKVQVQCRIHHWSTEPSDRLPFVEDHWKQSAEPLFPNSQSTPPQNAPDTSISPP